MLCKIYPAVPTFTLFAPPHGVNPKRNAAMEREDLWITVADPGLQKGRDNGISLSGSEGGCKMCIGYSLEITSYSDDTSTYDRTTVHCIVIEPHPLDFLLDKYADICPVGLSQQVAVISTKIQPR